MQKEVILTAPVVVLATVLGLVAMYSSQKPSPDNSRGDFPPSSGIATADSAAVPLVGHPRAGWLDRAVDAGAINAAFIDYGAMGETDPRFQARFFVLRRRPDESAGEGCIKIALRDATHTCWNDYAYHPYFAYDLGTLRQLAESDAAAAEVLALKLEPGNPEEALFFRLRAAHLSGKPGPLVAYLRMHSSRVDGSSGEIQNLDELLESYAIALVVDAMGYPYPQAGQRRGLLQRYGVPRDEQADAEAESERLLARLGEAR